MTPHALHASGLCRPWRLGANGSSASAGARRSPPPAASFVAKVSRAGEGAGGCAPRKALGGGAARGIAGELNCPPATQPQERWCALSRPSSARFSCARVLRLPALPPSRPPNSPLVQAWCRRAPGTPAPRNPLISLDNHIEPRP
jgi:hypothetical protein